MRAPLELPNKVTVLRPPRALIAAKLAAEGELWIANKAIYGLQASPAAWGRHRDGELKRIELRYQEANYRLEQARGDKSIWILRKQIPDNPAAQLDGPPAATLGVYVDDLLACGPRPLAQALLNEIANRWTISDPKYSDESGGFTFCGIQVEQTTTGLEIHQQSYIDALIERYPEIEGNASQPLLKEPDTSWTKEGEATLDRLRLGQKLVGEILWISTRTRPDIAYATSRLGQLLVKDIEYALAAGYELIRYLRGTRHYRIVYGAPREDRGSIGPWQTLVPNFLELFADASFCAGADRSQSGMILQWNDAPVAWLSLRQPTASLSTAEAELQAGIDCMTLAEGFTELFRELEGLPLKCVLYGDNQGAVTVLQIPQGAWRTRHLRLKASWFLEQVEENKYPVYHVPGQFMLGDICTKTLNGQRVRELLQLMGVAVVKAEGESGNVGVKSGNVGVKSLNVDSGGVPIKPGWGTLSESTSGLKNSGADSGGATQRSSELIDTLLESSEGEGIRDSPGIPGGSLLRCSELVDTLMESSEGEGIRNSPGIPGASLLRRALRLLVGAACLKRSLGRVVITVDTEPRDEAGAWVVALLAVLGILLLCVGLMVGVRYGNGEIPRILRMRAEESDDSEEWSVLTSAGQSAGSVDPPRMDSRTPRTPSTLFNPDGQAVTGLRRRTRRSHNIADPGPSDPRDPNEYLDPDESGLSRRTPRSHNVGNPPSQTLGLPEPGRVNPQGPVSSPHPDPQTLGYLNPEETLPDERRERGASRRPALPVGRQAEAAATSAVPVVGDGQIQGHIVQHADDLASVGHPDALPPDVDDVGLATRGTRAVPEQLDPLAVDEAREVQTSEEEGLSRGHAVTDPVETVVAPTVRADVGEATHQDRPSVQLCVYPGWTLRTPPREFWPPRPAWGDFQALWHQSIPTTVSRDFSYWDPDRGVLIRFHAAPRRRMYIPSESTLPPSLARSNLTGRRRTFLRLLNPVELEIEEDLLSDPRPQRQARRTWTGRTEFQLRP